MDNIKMWIELTMEESIRMAADRGKRTKYVHGGANPRIEDGQRTEQNKTDVKSALITVTYEPKKLILETNTKG